MARAGEAPEVVLEATYGWYWAADTLAELGAQVPLAHPLGVKMFSYRRVKTADGPVARGVDRPAGDPGAAAAGAAPGQAGRAALKYEVSGACGAGRCWGTGDDD
jgi:hypothetical protein